MTEETFVVLKDFPNYSINKLGMIKNNKTGLMRKISKSKRGYPCCNFKRK